MKISLLKYLFILLFIFGNGYTQTTPDEEPKTWLSFELNELAKQQAESGKPYLRFLDKPSMSMGLYNLPAGEQDEQNPHDRDEVYYIVNGRRS